jgi:hypothetical protein
MYPVNAGPTCDCLRRWAEKGRGASLLRVLLRSFAVRGKCGASCLCLGRDIQAHARPATNSFTQLRSGDVARGL